MYDILIVIVTEGAFDLDLNKRTADKVKNLLSKNLGLILGITTIRRVQRGGNVGA